ncbi:hypothetical protein SAMN04488524_0403 [Pedobacter africanus]|uniref:Uncharacterized protein n=2 Tax=Pedobacter africanus TaxID=151894 RepID=A0A1W1Z7E0_9SPHI|nr:hypothetical protein SAMN04488524_0403 [Pedobacter africanus]
MVYCPEFYGRYRWPDRSEYLATGIAGHYLFFDVGVFVLVVIKAHMGLFEPAASGGCGFTI